MTELMTSLLPTAFVGALAPLPIFIAVTLLMFTRGLAKATAFGVALTGVFAVIGIVVLATASTDAGSSEGGSAVTGTIIAVVGGVLMILALKQLFGAPDPDAGPPKLMDQLDTISPGGAAVLGLVIAIINVKTLGIYLAGVAQIVAADVTTAESWVALIILLAVMQLGVLGGIVIYVVARDWATRTLLSFQAWLVAHNRAIAIVLGLVVGTAFLLKGVGQITS